VLLSLAPALSGLFYGKQLERVDTPSTQESPTGFRSFARLTSGDYLLTVMGLQPGQSSTGTDQPFQRYGTFIIVFIKKPMRGVKNYFLNSLIE
jgi:hypothetical protein